MCPAHVLICELLAFSRQDYHWQWRSFLTSGFTAVYFIVYAVHYFFSKLQIAGLASTILYYGYTLIMALIFFLFSGELVAARLYLLGLISSVPAKRTFLSVPPPRESKSVSQIFFPPYFLKACSSSRYDWLLWLFLVCHKDLQCGQSGLKDQPQTEKWLLFFFQTVRLTSTLQLKRLLLSSASVSNYRFVIDVQCFSAFRGTKCIQRRLLDSFPCAVDDASPPPWAAGPAWTASCCTPLASPLLLLQL